MGKEAYQHGLLKRVKHHTRWLYKFLKGFFVHKSFFWLNVSDNCVQFLDLNPFLYLLNLLIDGVVPLVEVLLWKTGQCPLPRIILKLKAVLIIFRKLHVLRLRKLSNFSILKTDKVEILFLVAGVLFLVVEQLLTQKYELPRLKRVRIQTFLVKLSLPFIGPVF